MNERFDISTVSKLYQISPRTLRYYEEAGILQSHRKPDSKYREYDKKQCERLEIILLLRRLSFGMKEISELLNGDDAQFRIILKEKITQSAKLLLEAKETDRLLRDLEKELSKKPVSELSAVNILNQYAYLTNKTERTIPMNSPFNDKYRIALAMPFAVNVSGENEGRMLEKILALREELAKQSITFPIIRVHDDTGLSPNQAVIFWDGNEVWKKEFSQTEAVKCADEIVEQIRALCTKCED